MSKSILLVDANLPFLQRVSEAFTKQGYKVTTAKDGSEAYVKARSGQYDAVVATEEMPKLSGEPFVIALRENHVNKDCPIVIRSARVGQSSLLALTNVFSFDLNQSEDLLVEFVKSLMNQAQAVVKPKNVKLDPQFINPFIKATLSTLKTMCMVECEVLKPVIEKRPSMSLDITGTIPILSKDFEGVISICFPQKTFLALISNMLGETYTEINDENADAVGELVNIIYGASKRDLESMGLSVEKTVPTIIRGAGHSISHKSVGVVMIVPFKSSVGDFIVQICLIES